MIDISASYHYEPDYEDMLAMPTLPIYYDGEYSTIAGSERSTGASTPTLSSIVASASNTVTLSLIFAPSIRPLAIPVRKFTNASTAPRYAAPHKANRQPTKQTQPKKPDFEGF